MLSIIKEGGFGLFDGLWIHTPGKPVAHWSSERDGKWCVWEMGKNNMAELLAIVDTKDEARGFLKLLMEE